MSLKSKNKQKYQLAITERGKFSRSFDDEYCFVVNQGLVAVLSQAVVLLNRVIQQCIADVSSRLPVMFAQDRFKLLAHLFIAAVVNSIGVKDKHISRTHQRDFSDIGRVQLSLAELHRVVLVKIWVICRPRARNCT